VIEQKHLVADVERAGRFIEQQDAWRAHQQLREQDKLALAAAQGFDAMLRDAEQTEPIQVRRGLAQDLFVEA
jgi:hypothetical protein